MRVEVAWSMNEQRLIMTDLDEDQPLMTIVFHEKWSKALKAELAEEFLKALKR